MTLETSKVLGGVGALLMALIPFLGAYTVMLGLAGLILVMEALKGLSDHYGEKGIFDNARYGVILVIMGGVIFVAMVLLAALDLTDLLSIKWKLTLDLFKSYPATTIGSLMVLSAFVIGAAIFFRRSLTLLSKKTGVGLFDTTGLVILIGAILTIVGIGLMLLWVVPILLSASFFSIKT